MSGYNLPGTRAHVKAAADEMGRKFGIRVVGGYRAGAANHGLGLAVDFMCNRAQGDQLAAYAWNNRARLGVTEVIWRQRIITTRRASEGWRAMADRGSITQNHYDHVHVSFAARPGDSSAPPSSGGGGTSNVLDKSDGLLLLGPIPWIGGKLIDGGSAGLESTAAIGRFFAHLGERATWIRILQVVGGTGILVAGVAIVGRGTIAGAAVNTVMTATPAGRVANVATGAVDVAAKAAKAAS